jgi:hypothetical protein
MVDLGPVRVGCGGDAVPARPGDAVLGELGARRSDQPLAGCFSVAFWDGTNLSTNWILDNFAFSSVVS